MWIVEYARQREKNAHDLVDAQWRMEKHVADGKNQTEFKVTDHVVAVDVKWSLMKLRILNICDNSQISWIPNYLKFSRSITLSRKSFRG